MVELFARQETQHLECMGKAVLNTQWQVYFLIILLFFSLSKVTFQEHMEKDAMQQQSSYIVVQNTFCDTVCKDKMCLFCTTYCLFIHDIYWCSYFFLWCMNLEFIYYALKNNLECEVFKYQSNNKCTHECASCIWTLRKDRGREREVMKIYYVFSPHFMELEDGYLKTI